MTLSKLNEAISLIDNRYLDMVDLDEKRIIHMSNIQKRKFFRKRFFTVLIAAAILIFGCSATAFALNEDFNSAVLFFFKIEVKDKVEQVPGENLPLQPVREDGSGQAETPSITVSRICVPNNGHASDGLFYICADEVEYNSGNRYDIYDTSNGELTILQKNEYNAHCRIDGKDYHIQLEWAENGSSIGIGYVGAPELSDGSPVEACYIVCQTFYSDGPKALLLLESEGNSRPLIADLSNGTATLVEMNTENVQLEGICLAQISENGTTLLLQTTAPNIQYYGVDISSGKVVCLNDLCGSELSGCSFASDSKLVCWGISGGTSPEDLEELLIQQMSGEETTEIIQDYGVISAWIVTPEAETKELVLNGKPATAYTNTNAIVLGTGGSNSIDNGILCMSGRYAVERNADGSLVIYDFIENTQSSPANPTLSTTDSLDLSVSPDGTRLLLMERNNRSGALIRISVLDMENNSFITIDRDPAEVGNEHWADWFDANTVLVDNNTYDSSGNNTGESWYYLYQIGN